MIESLSPVLDSVFVQLFQVTLLFEVQHLSNFTLCHPSNASHTSSEVDLYERGKEKGC